MRRAVQAVVLVLALVVAGGMLVAAVSKVRDAADRTHCRNNFKSIGLALRTYHDTHNRFPPAAMANPHLPPERRLSWVVNIVPYVEADDIYSRMAKEKDWDAEENRFAAVLKLPYLKCPGCPSPDAASIAVPSDYIGIAGIGADALSLPEGDPRAGYFGYERKLTRGDLGERSANVLALLETARVEGAWTAAGRPTARGLERGDPPYLGDGGQFGGCHRGGANALFADVSVRFLSASVDPAALEAMATLKGGQPPVGED